MNRDDDVARFLRHQTLYLIGAANTFSCRNGASLVEGRRNNPSPTAPIRRNPSVALGYKHLAG